MKTDKELREEFYEKFVISSIAGETINDLGGVDEIWSWIEKKLRAKE